MTPPIINPATLTEKQREAIKGMYKECKLRSESEYKTDILTGVARVFMLKWLFGENFFKKGE